MRTEDSLALLKEWFPHVATRTAIAKFVARSIKRGHLSAPASWEFTHRTTFARLNVGQIAVVDLYPKLLVVYAVRTSTRDVQAIERDRDWRGYAAVPGKHDRWYVEPSKAGSIPRAIAAAHNQLIDAAWKAKRRSPHKPAHTPSVLEAISKLSGLALEQPEYFTDSPIRPPGAFQPGMFGDPETNVEVEKAAVERVRSDYERAGWTVTSREAERCGYDLECRRGRTSRHVEVKGRSSVDLAFTLTARELHIAETEPQTMTIGASNPLKRCTVSTRTVSWLRVPS